MSEATKQACAVLDEAVPGWMESGDWSIWEYPDLHRGAITLQIGVGDVHSPEAAASRAYAGRLLAAAGWRCEVAQVVRKGATAEYLVAYPPPVLHNFCPHPLTLRCYDVPAEAYHDVVLASEGNARVSQAPGLCREVHWLDTGRHIPIYGPSIYGEVADLPDPQPGHYYIVSMMVAQALPDRADLLVPGTGPADGAIREQGNIVAVTRLIAPNAR